MRQSPSDRLALFAFGVAVGGCAAWSTWRLWAAGEVLLAFGVATLAGVGALALVTGIRGR